MQDHAGSWRNWDFIQSGGGSYLMCFKSYHSWGDVCMWEDMCVASESTTLNSWFFPLTFMWSTRN